MSLIVSKMGLWLLCLAAVVAAAAAFPPMASEFECTIYNARTGAHFQKGVRQGVLAAEIPGGRMVRDYREGLDYIIITRHTPSGPRERCLTRPITELDKVYESLRQATLTHSKSLGQGAGKLVVDHWRSSQVTLPNGNSSHHEMGLQMAGGLGWPVYFRDARRPDDLILYYNVSATISHPTMWQRPNRRSCSTRLHNRPRRAARYVPDDLHFSLFSL